MKQKLPTAKRVSPSTALLDDDNVLISPEQRSDLKHQQITEDKQAVAGRLAEVTKQLAEAEEKLARDQSDLDDLVQERARWIVDKKPVHEICDQIVELEQSIEQAPSVIACLRERIADLQKERQQEQRDHNLFSQKESARQMERLSQVLVEQLRQALDTNQTLQACSRNYVRLREATGVDTVSSRVCQGSHGSLQALYEICKQELEGKRGMRQQLRAGQTPL